MLTIPEFKNKDEKIKFLVENKGTLIAQKKAQVKHADGFMYVHVLSPDCAKVEAVKANAPVEGAGGIDELKVKVIINTTNFMDSHEDVHLKGIWNKSLKENRFIMHLQEHQSGQFDKIIAEGVDLKVSVQEFTFKELGFDYGGTTQALVFESIVKRSRNPFMLDQYANGYVKNHSVGMRYVKILLAVNDEKYAVEFDAWEKYYPEIANKAEADRKGYFYVVKEAKVIEGSAVPLGSNTATPTLENNMPKTEPSAGTPKKADSEPPKGTRNKSIELLEMLKNKL